MITPFEEELRGREDLLTWYDASKVAGIADGARVVALGDQSGNGWHLTAPALGPIYRATGMNGHPTLEFSSTNSILAASAEILPYTNFTIIAVIDDWTGGRPFGWEHDGGGSHGLGYFTSPSWIIRSSGNNYDLGTGGYNGSIPHILTLRMTPRYGAKSEVLTTGGTLIWRFANTASVSWTSAGQTMKLGSSGNGSAHATVKISEFLTFSSALSDGAYARVTALLSRKYAGIDSGIAGMPAVLETQPESFPMFVGFEAAPPTPVGFPFRIPWSE